LDDCSRRSLTRFVSLMISRHSEALWRALGCTGHEPLLPPCGRGRLLRSPWPPVTAATTRAVDRGFWWSRSFFFFLLPSHGTTPEPSDWAAPVCGAECYARPSAALAHLSARAKSVGTISTSCVANFSNIFSSRTPWRKAVMMEASEMRGTSHLGEAGDERPESLPGLLPHCVEVGLHTVLLVSVGEVRNKSCAELFPKVD
jgi:hypothetical protein